MRGTKREAAIEMAHEGFELMSSKDISDHIKGMEKLAEARLLDSKAVDELEAEMEQGKK